MSHHVGVDLGATAVRVVETKGRDHDGRPQVVAATRVPMPPGAFLAGQVAEPGQVAHTLRRALHDAKVSRYGPVLGLSTANMALATVTMSSAIKPAEWESVMRLEDRQISAKLALADSLLSFQRLTPPGEDTDMVTLAVAAVSREDVEAFMEMCSLAKVTPRALDLSAAAVFRGMAAFPAGDHASVSTVVDVGASKTLVATRQGLRLRSVRTFDEGGESVTRALAGALNLDMLAAEKLKMSQRVGDLDTKPKSSAAAALASAYGNLEDKLVSSGEDPKVTASRAVTAAADQIVEEVAAAIEADTAEHPEHPTRSIVLCGRAALLHGFAERVQARLGVPATVRRPFLKVTESARTTHLFVDGTADPDSVLELATATGLSTWKELS